MRREDREKHKVWKKPEHIRPSIYEWNPTIEEVDHTDVCGHIADQLIPGADEDMGYERILTKVCSTVFLTDSWR